MAAPRFIQASAGATDATGAFTFTGTASGTIGDLVVLQIVIDGTGAISWGTITPSNVNDLSGAAGWTLVGTWNIGSAATGQMRVYLGRRTSSSSAPTFAASANTSGDDVYGLMYEFRDVSAGTTLAEVIENSTAGSTANAAATSTTCSDVGVTTLGPDRLALNFVGLTDDAMGLAAFAGETGGDWVLPVAIYETATGTDATVALMTSVGPWTVGFTGTTFGAVNLQGGVAAESSQRLAQSFLTSGAFTASGAHALVNTVGSPSDNLIAEIQTDSGGVPSGVAVGSSGLIAASTLSGTPRWVSISLSASLSASTTYWLVLSRSGANDTTNYFQLSTLNEAYADGSGAVESAAAWTGGQRDRYFGVSAITGGTIDGGSDTITSVGWGVVGFALIGTTVVATLPPQHAAVDFGGLGVMTKAREAWERKGSILVPRLWTPEGATI